MEKITGVDQGRSERHVAIGSDQQRKVARILWLVSIGGDVPSDQIAREREFLKVAREYNEKALKLIRHLDNNDISLVDRQ